MIVCTLFWEKTASCTTFKMVPNKKRLKIPVGYLSHFFFKGPCPLKNQKP